MAYYPKEEQETVYLFDAIDGNWRVHSSYPPHIRKLLDASDIEVTETDEEGKAILVTGTVEAAQVRLYKR